MRVTLSIYTRESIPVSWGQQRRTAHCCESGASHAARAHRAADRRGHSDARVRRLPPDFFPASHVSSLSLSLSRERCVCEKMRTPPSNLKRLSRGERELVALCCVKTLRGVRRHESLSAGRGHRAVLAHYRGAVESGPRPEFGAFETKVGV